ncbi:TorD/DmsD family molecular chaperone [Ferrimonas lipolytica]|uniref:Cytoplasmic chaperone TorD family protein n=1 Tax=Ferrimonas lipolytica TaxID=2724191 RepID=A0A6H1UI02_9GAMM|nr:molecular chaperone TorD family protein [Ferrimonas lipolytica]QIZ78259.1 cytoplasmic chaperone TorD family protein [Ferrimonas lipolytica]
MTQTDLLPYASAISGVLHNLYFNKPTTEFLADFRAGTLLRSWPQLGDATTHQHAIELIQSSLNELTDEQIERDYYRLFIGPGEMQAYPWGSVYTDRENLLFGASTQALLTFLQRWQVEVNLDSHQPHDHIGLLLGVLGQLLANEQLVAVDELLQQHLMPWAPRLLECIDMGANSGFYRGFGMLTQALLNRLMAERELTAHKVQLFK